MKIGLLTLVCFLFVAIEPANRHEGKSELAPSSAPSQPTIGSNPAPTAVSWAAKLLHGVQSYDFGSVPYGDSLKHRFRVTNIYAVPMQITSIRHGCGCVAVSSSHSNGEALAPGAEGWIDVTLDARRFVGHKKNLVLVTFGPHHVDTAAIEITANVKSP